MKLGAACKRFQKATVAAAVQALRDPAGSRRFLVADEVGLGKTLVARGVIEELMRRPASPPRIFYVCSSLGIAHQNTARLLEILPEQDRDAARVQVDRLGLVPSQPRPGPAPFHLYSLTPDTSIRTTGRGRAEERVLIGRALQQICGLRESEWLRGALQGAVGQRWKSLWDSNAWPDDAEAYLEPFKRRLRRELGLKEHAWTSTLTDAVRQRLRDGNEASLTDTVGRLRRAVTLAVIDVVAPDLVIFDEFQRFFEVLVEDDEEGEHDHGDEDERDHEEEAHHVLRAMLSPEAAGGHTQDRRPAVLLLSATPYRMFARFREGGQHHDELFQLLRFLFADTAGQHLAELKRDFDAYRDALIRDAPGSARALEAKRRIEQRLRRVMARTERELLAPPSQDRRRRTRSTAEAPVTAQDLVVFRHFLESVRDDDRYAVEAYWSSIPYPLQMMGNDYAASRHADPSRAGGLAKAARLVPARLGDYTYEAWAHPRLRGLLQRLPADLLKLPWLPPSRPWWPLAAPFADFPSATKALVFSRFRAIPRALATLLSYEAERRAFGGAPGRRRYGYFRTRSVRAGRRPRGTRRLRPLPAEAFTFGTSSGHNRRLLLMFLPLPALAAIGDPLAMDGIASGTLDRAAARAQVRARLVEQLGEDRSRTRRDPLGWALALERRNAAGWSALRKGAAAWVAKEGKDHGRASRSLRQALAAAAPAGSPSPGDLEDLADLALTGPGVALYRAVQRVFGGAKNEAERIEAVCRISLGPLRTYLDGPEWHLVLKQQGGRRSHADAVRAAVWGGNLEAVLDEYLITLQGVDAAEVHHEGEAEALAKLGEVLGVHHGARLQVHTLLRGKAMRLRCHAVLPFGLGAGALEEQQAVRGDRVRDAFNSPFRPMALVTTSIGQEGLDYHRYCRHVVHWDLPSNPVDLEQREGRVDRHGGLAVRRALAGRIVDLPHDRSPWRSLAARLRAEESAGGLVPWWQVEGAEILRSAVMPSFSEQAGRLAALEADLALYRYALGQPDQEALVRALARRLDRVGEEDRAKLRRWLREVAIDLCPLPPEERDAG
ncbi:helicase-related protein [Sorangium sp. So ce176]|uniref:helicase-related protein n=1 Tax=Sorangium sp. So ce176 TaxID=3133286 RepID=UPI003F6253A3